MQACISTTMELKMPQTGGKLLDTEFRKVEMHGHIMGELDHVFQAVRSNTPHKSASFSIELSAETPRQGWGPDRTSEEIENHNASVDIHLRNVTLREILDVMTTQAGWDYYIAPQEVIFIAGRNVTRTPHVQSGWAGERKVTGSGSKNQQTKRGK